MSYPMLANVTLDVIECYPEYTKIAVETGLVNFCFTLSGCMHPEDEIEPLLRGEDYKYSDCELTIEQKDGITSFILATDNGTDFNISFPATLCSESLRKWVYACRDNDSDPEELFSYPC